MSIRDNGAASRIAPSGETFKYTSPRSAMSMCSWALTSTQPWLCLPHSISTCRVWTNCGYICGAPMPCVSYSALMYMPEDLTEVLETCLAEDASPNKCLSKVRQIIINLLHGFRGKQSMYRRIMSKHQSRQRSSPSRTDSRSSWSDKTSSRQKMRHVSNPICPTAPLPMTSKRKKDM